MNFSQKYMGSVFFGGGHPVYIRENENQSTVCKYKSMKKQDIQRMILFISEYFPNVYYSLFFNIKPFSGQRWYVMLYLLNYIQIWI